LGMIEDAIDIAGSELTVLPELYLLKGDLLLAVPQASGFAAEPWFQRGFDLAEDLDAKMSQLRASVRLCRLWRDHGKPGKGSRPLRALYETFTEGFATVDLREASDLLTSPS
jgi:hypothetical protein